MDVPRIGRLMLRGLVIYLGMIVLALPLRAAPLDRRQLPAEVVWFFHLDAEAAHTTILGKGMRDAILAQPQAQRAIERVKETIGIDPIRDLSGITAYGVDFAPDESVLIVRGNVDRPRLLDLLAKAPGYRAETLEGHDIYTWSEPDNERTSSGAFFGQDTIVISRDIHAVVKALEVLEEKGPSLAADSPLLASATVEPGVFVQAGAVGLADARNVPIHSPILRQCESGSITVGEQSGEVFVDAKVNARSAETASKMRLMIEGAKAMAQLQAGDESDLGRLLAPVSVTSVDRSVEIRWRYPSADLVKYVQAQAITFAPRPQPVTQP